MRPLILVCLLPALAACSYTTAPYVMLDEAHHNVHTMNGRYRPFVELIASAGYAALNLVGWLRSS